MQLKKNFAAVVKTAFELGPKRKNILGAGKVFVLLQGARNDALLDQGGEYTETKFWHCEVTGACEEFHFQQMDILKINEHNEFTIKANLQPTYTSNAGRPQRN